MTLRPSAPSWSERSRRTRHRLTLSGNRPTDRVAGSLRTACRRDPPLPPNLIRAGQRPGAGPTPLARDTLVAPFERIPVAPQQPNAAGPDGRTRRALPQPASQTDGRGADHRVPGSLVHPNGMFAEAAGPGRSRQHAQGVLGSPPVSLPVPTRRRRLWRPSPPIHRSPTHSAAL